MGCTGSKRPPAVDEGDDNGSDDDTESAVVVQEPQDAEGVDVDQQDGLDDDSAPQPGQQLLAGTLHRKGHVISGGWKARFYVLKQGEGRKALLESFDKKPDSMERAAPKTQYGVTGVYRVPARGGSSRENRLDVECDNGDIIALSVDTAEKLERWIHEIESATRRIPLQDHPRLDEFRKAANDQVEQQINEERNAAWKGSSPEPVAVPGTDEPLGWSASSPSAESRSTGNSQDQGIVGQINSNASDKGAVYATEVHNQGNTFRRQGRLGQALTKYEEALSIFKREFGEDHAQVAQVNGNMAIVLQRQERYDEAMTKYEEAQTVLSRVLGPSHPAVTTIMSNMATCHKDTGNMDAALNMHQNVLRIRQEAPAGATSPDVAQTMMNMAIIAEEMCDWGEALRLAGQAHKIFVQKFGAAHQCSIGADELVARATAAQR